MCALIGSTDITILLIQPGKTIISHQLITNVQTYLDTSPTSDHSYLKQLAENAMYLDGQAIVEYLTNYEAIRAKTLAAWYSDIEDPASIITFMIAGLKQNPRAEPIGMQLIIKKPPNPKYFVNKFNKLN